MRSFVSETEVSFFTLPVVVVEGCGAVAWGIAEEAVGGGTEVTGAVDVCDWDGLRGG